MRRFLSVCTALVAVLMVPAAARADALGSDCSSQGASQAFAQWGDPFSYTLAPGGDAESASGLTLSGGASIQAGNESYSVLGSGANHLELPAGASATTDPACVGLGSPDFRFFAKASGATLGSVLRVDAIVAGSAVVPVGAVTPSSGWTPTPAYAIVGNLVSAATQTSTTVRLRFTPVGVGRWSVDDVLIDPWRYGG